jgi:hypothetical protein
MDDSHFGYKQKFFKKTLISPSQPPPPNPKTWGRDFRWTIGIISISFFLKLMFILEHSVEILYYYNLVVASGLLIGQEFGILFLSQPPNPPHPPP